MPLTFTKGDLLETEGLHAFAHGCSAAGVMDAGVSGAFKKKWPRMFDDYRQRCADGRFHIGDVCVWSDEVDTVYSLCSQEHWKQKAKIAALVRSLQKMTELAKHAGIERIGLPRIGTGLGGLDWQRVKRVLAEAGQQTDVSLVVFDQFIRARVPSG